MAKGRDKGGKDKAQNKEKKKLRKQKKQLIDDMKTFGSIHQYLQQNILVAHLVSHYMTDNSMEIYNQWRRHVTYEPVVIPDIVLLPMPPY